MTSEPKLHVRVYPNEAAHWILLTAFDNIHSHRGARVVWVFI